MRKLVYVVDDELTSLEVLVMLLQMIDAEWIVKGFHSPVKALEAIKATPPDLLISDQCMTEMSGGDLLEAARTARPETIRIIISGYIDPGRLSKIPSAHQYIEKPFALHRISAIIRQTFEAQALLDTFGIKDFVMSLRSLPTMPSSYHMLLNALDNPNGSTELIAQIIAADPFLTARVLRVANSSFYRRQSEVTNPLEAVFCLGTELIKSIVISQQVSQQFEQLKDPVVSFSKEWELCWKTAQFAQKFASKYRLLNHTNEAFLAGLLHMLGEMALCENFPGKFRMACDLALEKSLPLHAAVKQVFGINPASLTAYLLVLWGIPKAVVNATLYQHAPAEEGAASFNVTTALYLAHGLAIRQSTGYQFSIPEWDREHLMRLGVDDLSVV